MKKKTLSALISLILVLLIAFLGGPSQDAPQAAPAEPTQLITESVTEASLPTEDPLATEAPPATEAPLPAEAPPATEAPIPETEPPAAIDEFGSYTSKEDVALYIHTYGHLPDNFITKQEARKLGWEGGGLDKFAPGMCIGGDRFGNYEGLLPEEEGREWTECDIDTLGADKRGAKRIVFSNDGLIYYTDDHYESFHILYGEPRYENCDH